MNYLLILPLLVSFFVTLLMLPSWIKSASKFGFVGKDMNKYDQRKVSEGGGLLAVTGFILGILIYVSMRRFLFGTEENIIEIFAITTSLLILAMIGFIDGSLGWRIGLRKRTRLSLCLFAAVPLMVINAGQSVFALPFIGSINSGLLYPLILIPLGVVATSTTFNILAGWNGLEAGQGIIIITALSIVALFTGQGWLAFVGLIVVLSLIAFLAYNLFPARVFPGDVLTYPLGGLIAIMAIIGNFERIAVFFFIPYIIEVVLKVRGGLIKQSFGKPLEDGSVDLRYPKIYSVNHFAIWLLKKVKMTPTEKRVVFLVWAFQIAIVILGFLIFRESVFV